MTNSANTQAGASPLNGVVPPKDKQFGKPNGNKQGRGFWKKEDTARFKLEQMIKLSEDELREILDDPDAPMFERRIAQALIEEGNWKTTESMINQIYGNPKTVNENINIETKPLIDLTEDKNGKLRDNDAKKN